MIMNAPIYLIYLHFYFINSDLLEYSYAERHLNFVSCNYSVYMNII